MMAPAAAAPQDEAAAKAAAAAPAEFAVVNCGASYKKPGEDPVISRHFALKGAIIELEADEAERLVALAAVRPVSDLDEAEVARLRAAQAVAQEVPAVREHAEPLESNEDNAAKVKAAKATSK
jgi:hypothetical protein